MEDQLLGPLGLTMALLIAVGALWRFVLDVIRDLRAQRDRAVAGWEAQTAATNRLADALETSARDQSSRRRQSDR